MLYISKKGNAVSVSKTAPETGRYFTVEKLPEVSIPEGFTAKLTADFETKTIVFVSVETPEHARARVVSAIESYDKSDSVNSFFVGGMPMWLDRETRTSLARTIAIDAEAGEATFSMWAAGSPPVRFDIPIAMATPMLDALERYAKATYNVTQSHIAALYALDTVAEIEAYDYTAGYPEKLEFAL